MPILVRKVTAGDAVPFFPTYLGPSQSVPVATGRVRWCYPPLSLAVTRCQSLLAGSAGITRHLAGLALAAGCYRPCSSVIDIAANYDWPVLLELNRR